MVGAQERDDDRPQLHGHKPKASDIPPLQQEPLEPDIRAFASRELGSGITRLGDSRFDERRKVSTALQFVLDAETTEDAELAGPLGVDFAFEVEGDAFVGEIPGDDEECECDPAEEGVEAEEGAVVEEDACPAY